VEFTYKARNSAGKMVEGTVDVADKAAVQRALRGRNLTPISIEQKGRGLNAEISIPGFGPKVKTKDLAVFTRQFSTMLAAGLPLLRALTILAEQTENSALQTIISTVRVDVEAGKSLTAALQEHEEFPRLYVAMVRAGEATGLLDQVLGRLAETLEKEVELRGKIKSSLTYPVIVLAMAAVLAVALLIFIVPTFEAMFASLGGNLPLPTQVLVSVSDFLRTPFGVVLLVGVPVAARFGWRRAKRSRAGREQLDALKLRLPVVGMLFRKFAIARFARTFAVLLNAGVPVLQAIEITSDTSGNVLVSKALGDVRASVQAGENIAGPLGEHALFPPMVVQMVAVGEEVAAVDTMLEKLADFYEAEVDATTESLTALLEPAMVGVLGGTVGGMVITLYLPIFDIISLVQ